ncbi:hypothetical protein TruAng_003886 [Truncatella angustata]|nr:hypothetical protein TruAng_003886 [Truncatella angustata]
MTAFVKVSQLQRLASIDFFYDGVDLIIWGAAETATTIIATSIPVLRVLLNEIKTSSGGNYFKTLSKDRTKTPKTQASRVRIIVTANRRATMPDRGDDAASDKNILPKNAHITRTAEVTMTYGKRTSDEESEYEMDEFDQQSINPHASSTHPT